MEFHDINSSLKTQKNLGFKRIEKLKLCLLIGLSKLVTEKGRKIRKTYQVESEEKRMGKTCSHLNNSFSFIIEPIPISIRKMEEIQSFYGFLGTKCKRKLQRNQKTFLMNRTSAGSMAFKISKTKERLIEERLSNIEKKKDLNEIVNFVEINHNRHLSDTTGKQNETRAPSKIQSSQISFKLASISKKVEYFKNKKNQQIKFLKKNLIQFASIDAQCNALAETIKIVFRNMSSANHYLNASCFQARESKEVENYVKQLIPIYHVILDNLYKINKKLGIDKDHCKITNGNKSFEEYFNLCDELIDRLKELMLLLNCEEKMEKVKPLIDKLIEGLFLSRYYLRYLQKQIENKNMNKKNIRNLSKWQKSYFTKFIGRRVF